MHLDFEILGNGLRVKSGKAAFNLAYPRKIWQNFSAEGKRFFLDNLAYSNTVCSPLVSGIRNISYNTSKPLIKRYIDKSILRDIPSAVEDYQTSTAELIKQFRETNYAFKDNKIKKPIFSGGTCEKAVVPFSCGKDSLLTLAVCNEIGLGPVAVYFNDTVSPSENRFKINCTKKISQKLGIKIEIIRDSIEKLNDFEFWGKRESVIGYSHLVFNFCLLSFPINFFYGAKYLVLGNEYDLNSKFRNKDGIWCYPSYDQSFEGTRRLDRIFRMLSCGKIQVASVVSPISDLIMMRILHGRYEKFGRYQSSCASLDTTKKRTWCCSCNDAMRVFT